MKKIFTQCILTFFTVFCIATIQSNAQPGVGISYTFSSTAGNTPYPTTGSLNQTFAAGSQDDNGALIAPAGMSIRFGCAVYTKFVVSTNGWLALVPNIAIVPPVLSFGGYLNANSLATYTGGYPLIAPFWDDNATTAVSYNWTGGDLWVRWSSKVDKNNAAAGFLFWVRINGTTGVINYYYSGTPYAVSGSPSGSVGLAGVCTGDYYAYDHGSGKTYADSTSENSSCALPTNVTYTFTPYQLYDDCASAKDLGTVTATCTPATYVINHAGMSGSPICSTTDERDVWFKVTKPVGVSNVTITTSPASGCQLTSGTSIEVFSSCGGPSLGCSASGSAYPTYGEVTVSRPPCSVETLYVRVTADGDLGCKFGICAKDAGASAGTGNTCASANWICSIPYTYSGTTAGSGNDYDSTSSVCHSLYMNGEDYVFAYTPTANGCIKIDLSSPGTNPAVYIMSGCPSPAAAPGTYCLGSAEFSTGSGSIYSTALVAGQTYYIVVDNNNIIGNTNNPFTINVTNAGAGPAYDVCTSAHNFGTIASGVSCVPVTLTTSCSTPTPVGQAGYPSCIPPQSPSNPIPFFNDGATGDVWMRFTAGFSGSILINTFASTNNPTEDAAMAVYTGACGSMGAPFACDYNSGSNGMPSLSFPVANGTTYYIRLWTEHPLDQGFFDICFQSACAPPNDLPCGAIQVPSGGTITGFNTCASGTGEPANAAQCVTGGTVNTVWFYYIVPASGQVRVRTSPLTLTDTQIQAFSFPGGCVNAATNNTPRTCNDDGLACSGGNFNDFSEQLYTGLTAGETLYVAVDGVSSLTGSFGISMTDGTPAPPVPQQDCGAAQIVCSTQDIVVADPGFRNYGNVCDLTTGVGCWGIGERNSVWYQFTVNPPATITFDILSQAGADLDFLLWDVTTVANPCAAIASNPPLSPTSCNFAAAGASTGISVGGTGHYSPAVSVTGAVPRTYILLINNYNSFANAGFTLDWGNTPISNSATTANWSGLIDDQWQTTTNWGDCGGTPTCAIDAVIGPVSNNRYPIVANALPAKSVRNLTINAGATLTLAAGATLNVCGNFVNNGTLVCNAGSTINFMGTGVNQTISGNVVTPNSFANLTITKPSAANNVQILSNIDVAGNFTTANATSVFSFNTAAGSAGKYMKVGGNFTNANGTSTFTNISGSTVEFYLSASQNFTNNAGTINLNRVVMNKPAGKLNLVGAFSTMNIDSFLTLTSGNIVTTSAPALEVNMKYYLPAAITGHSAASYIEGKLRRKISNGPFSSPITPANYDFPLGNAVTPGGYENARITFTSPVLVTDILGTFTSWPSGPPANGPAANECNFFSYDGLPIFDNGYWTFTRTGANFTGNYNVTLNNTGMTNNTGTYWTVAKADLASNPALAASWGLIGTCIPGSTAAATVRNSFNSPAADVTSFNHHYATVQDVGVFPIELLYFTAEPKGEEVLCKWETASEINNEYFEVERSDDGKEFRSIGRVAGFGHGTSTENRDYSLIDYDNCKDIRYYRLKQVDIDGTYSYSDQVAINCKPDKMELFPNPANTFVTYQFYYPMDTELTLTIHDISGRIVRHETINVLKGINRLTSKIEDLAAGAYNLRITGAENVNIRLQAQFFKN